MALPDPLHAKDARLYLSNWRKKPLPLHSLDTEWKGLGVYAFHAFAEWRWVKNYVMFVYNASGFDEVDF